MPIWADSVDFLYHYAALPKDVLEFGQGSVIELDKQTGSPAEIMVNGQLLAYGDVVVVGDNFGVRITEIVGTKDLLDSLDTKK